MKQSDFRKKYVFNLERVSERVSVDMDHGR